MTAAADPTAVDAVADLVSARTGIVLSAIQRATLSTWLPKAVEEEPARWVDRLAADVLLLDSLIAEVTVGETYFFREPEHFNAVRRDVIPAHTTHTLRVWSAGCATGEEAYSLAILFDECAAKAEVLGTDISHKALTKARAGIYSRWSLRGEGARLVGSYLRPAADDTGERFQVIDRMRRAVRFAAHNLAGPGDYVLLGGPFDVVFCRNVLIYLEPAAIRRIATRLYDCLAEDGLLFTGPSDPLLGDYAPFETITGPGGAAYRRRKGRARAPAPLPAAAEFSFALQPVQPASDPVVPAPAGPPAKPDPLAAARACADQGDMAQAATLAAEAVRENPASPEALFLHAVVLMNLARHDEAERTFKRLAYLDPGLAMGHFMLGTLHRRTGDVSAARRAFRAAHDAAASRPPQEPVPLSEGETAERLAAAALALAMEDGGQGKGQGKGWRQ